MMNIIAVKDTIIKIIEIIVTLTVKLFGMFVRFFRIATNRKTLSNIIIRKIDKNAKRSLIINHKSISSVPPITFSSMIYPYYCNRCNPFSRIQLVLYSDFYSVGI